MKMLITNTNLDDIIDAEYEYLMYYNNIITK